MTALFSIIFKTPLGNMLALSNQSHLVLLEFADKPKLENELEKLKIKTKANIISKRHPVLEQIKGEIKSYFNGQLTEFKTPMEFFGTPFQKRAWLELKKINYGQTKSYLDQATLMGNPKAFRAVANANGANKIAIAIPCHRIIAKSGNLGGYSAGLERKRWLIDHEKKLKNN